MRTLIILLSVLLFISCSKEEIKRSIYDITPVSETEWKVNSTVDNKLKLYYYCKLSNLNLSEEVKLETIESVFSNPDDFKFSKEPRHRIYNVIIKNLVYVGNDTYKFGEDNIFISDNHVKEYLSDIIITYVREDLRQSFPVVNSKFYVLEGFVQTKVSDTKEQKRLIEDVIPYLSSTIVRNIYTNRESHRWDPNLGWDNIDWESVIELTSGYHFITYGNDEFIIYDINRLPVYKISLYQKVITVTTLI